MDSVSSQEGEATTHDCSDSWIWGDEEENFTIDELFDTLTTRLHTKRNRASDAEQKQQQNEEIVSNICKRNRNVHFSDKAIVIPCNDSDDRVDQDPGVCWYTYEEMETIFNGIVVMAELSNRYDENELKAVQDCLRGLEDLKRSLLLIAEGEPRKNAQQCIQTSLNKNKNRKLLPHQKFIQSILNWQCDQRASGVNLDPIGLMMFASACSKQSRDMAIVRAAQDFLEVKKIWNIKEKPPHRHQHQTSSRLVSAVDDSPVKGLGCQTQSVATAASSPTSLQAQMSALYDTGKQSHDYSSYF